MHAPFFTPTNGKKNVTLSKVTTKSRCDTIFRLHIHTNILMWSYMRVHIWVHVHTYMSDEGVASIEAASQQNTNEQNNENQNTTACAIANGNGCIEMCKHSVGALAASYLVHWPNCDRAVVEGCLISVRRVLTNYEYLPDGGLWVRNISGLRCGSIMLGIAGLKLSRILRSRMLVNSWREHNYEEKNFVKHICMERLRRQMFCPNIFKDC